MIVSPLYVYGSLTVTDSSAEKTGWIDGLVNAKEEGGTLSFETVRTVSNCSDLDQVLLINQQGAKVSARLAKDLSVGELTIPAGESLSLDLNGKLLICSPPVAKESVGVADDGTVEITVPSNVSSGFYRLQSKGERGSKL